MVISSVRYADDGQVHVGGLKGLSPVISWPLPEDTPKAGMHWEHHAASNAHFLLVLVGGVVMVWSPKMEQAVLIKEHALDGEAIAVDWLPPAKEGAAMDITFVIATRGSRTIRVITIDTGGTPSIKRECIVQFTTVSLFSAHQAFYTAKGDNRDSMKFSSLASVTSVPKSGSSSVKTIECTMGEKLSILDVYSRKVGLDATLAVLYYMDDALFLAIYQCDDILSGHSPLTNLVYVPSMYKSSFLGEGIGGVPAPIKEIVELASYTSASTEHAVQSFMASFICDKEDTAITEAKEALVKNEELRNKIPKTQGPRAEMISAFEYKLSQVGTLLKKVNLKVNLCEMGSLIASNKPINKLSVRFWFLGHTLASILRGVVDGKMLGSTLKSSILARLGGLQDDLLTIKGLNQSLGVLHERVKIEEKQNNGHTASKIISEDSKSKRTADVRQAPATPEEFGSLFDTNSLAMSLDETYLCVHNSKREKHSLEVYHVPLFTSDSSTLDVKNGVGNENLVRGTNLPQSLKLVREEQHIKTLLDKCLGRLSDLPIATMLQMLPSNGVEWNNNCSKAMGAVAELTEQLNHLDKALSSIREDVDRQRTFDDSVEVVLAVSSLLKSLLSKGKVTINDLQVCDETYLLKEEMAMSIHAIRSSAKDLRAKVAKMLPEFGSNKDEDTSGHGKTVSSYSAPFQMSRRVRAAVLEKYSRVVVRDSDKGLVTYAVAAPDETRDRSIIVRTSTPEANDTVADLSFAVNTYAYILQPRPVRDPPKTRLVPNEPPVVQQHSPGSTHAPNSSRAPSEPIISTKSPSAVSGTTEFKSTVLSYGQQAIVEVGSKTPEIIREEVTKIYNKYNPDKVPTLPDIFEKYKGREIELLKKVQDKYNLTSTPGVSTMTSETAFNTGKGTHSEQWTALVAKGGELLLDHKSGKITSYTIGTTPASCKNGTLNIGPNVKHPVMQAIIEIVRVHDRMLFEHEVPELMKLIVDKTGDERTQGEQKLREFLSALCKRFAITDPVLPTIARVAPPAGDTAESVQAEITKIYQHHNKDKLQELPRLFEKYKGREDELLKKVQDRYNIQQSTNPSGASTATSSGLFVGASSRSGVSPISSLPAGQPLFRTKTDISSLFGGGKKSTQDLQNEITDIYKQHNPDKLSTLPSIFDKYKGREDELLKKVRERYRISAQSTGMGISASGMHLFGEATRGANSSVMGSAQAGAGEGTGGIQQSQGSLFGGSSSSSSNGANHSFQTGSMTGGSSLFGGGGGSGRPSPIAAAAGSFGGNGQASPLFGGSGSGNFTSVTPTGSHHNSFGGGPSPSRSLFGGINSNKAGIAANGGTGNFFGQQKQHLQGFGGGTHDQIIAEITQIYQQYNPSKLQELPRLLEKYVGREDQMLDSLRKKYGSQQQQPQGGGSYFGQRSSNLGGSLFSGGQSQQQQQQQQQHRGSLFGATGGGRPPPISGAMQSGFEQQQLRGAW